MDFLETNEQNFANYLNHVIRNYEANFGISNQKHPVSSTHLIFFPVEFGFDFRIFYNRNIFLEINFYSRNENQKRVLEKLLEKLDFLFSDQRFFDANEKQIRLKSTISEDELNRAKMIFYAEKEMNIYFYPETNEVMSRINSNVFREFIRTLDKIHETLYENFEMYDLSKLPFLKQKENMDYDKEINLLVLEQEENMNYDNELNLPEMINWFYIQKSKEQKRPIVVRKRNWVQKTYIFLKKLGFFKPKN